MGWRTTDDVAQFLAAAGGFLRAERARNTVILTVTEQMRLNPSRYPAVSGNGPLLGWWSDPAGSGHPCPGLSSTVGGAFLHTPPFPIVLTDVPGGVAEDLAVTLGGRPLAGVNADPMVAEAFASAWRAATGCRVQVHREQRLYRLTGLSWPDPAPPGAARIATETDADLLTEWYTAFAREVNDLASRADQASAVRERLGYGGLMLWEAGDEPVSLAGVTRQVAGMARVGPVYTPTELRGHGYASAVTAAISQRALDAGAEEVLLYTDLDNPVSNSIYQRIGYRPVEDRVVLAFSQIGLSWAAGAVIYRLPGLSRRSRPVCVGHRKRGRSPALEAVRDEVVRGRAVKASGDHAASGHRYPNRQRSRRAPAPVGPVDEQFRRIHPARWQHDRAGRQVRDPPQPHWKRLPVSPDDGNPGGRPRSTQGREPTLVNSISPRASSFTPSRPAWIRSTALAHEAVAETGADAVLPGPAGVPPELAESADAVRPASGSAAHNASPASRLPVTDNSLKVTYL